MISARRTNKPRSPAKKWRKLHRALDAGVRAIDTIVRIDSRAPAPTQVDSKAPIKNAY